MSDTEKFIFNELIERVNNLQDSYDKMKESLIELRAEYLKTQVQLKSLNDKEMRRAPRSIERALGKI